jgi:hypothetical protein
MKTKTPTSLALIALVFFTLQKNTIAENIVLSDISYTIVGAPSSAVNVSLRFGLWNSSTFAFTQQVFSDHLGYAALTGDELQINLSQTDNTVYSSTTQLALAVFTKSGLPDAGPLDYSLADASFRAIFTNPNWVVGSLAANTNEREFFLDASTTAVLDGSGAKIGDFSFNGGNQTITLIPEPSTGALMMIGAVGLVALRRLRKV